MLVKKPDQGVDMIEHHDEADADSALPRQLAAERSDNDFLADVRIEKTAALVTRKCHVMRIRAFGMDFSPGQWDGEYRSVPCRSTIKMGLLVPSAPGPLGRATQVC